MHWHIKDRPTDAVINKNRQFKGKPLLPWLDNVLIEILMKCPKPQLRWDLFGRSLAFVAPLQTVPGQAVFHGFNRNPCVRSFPSITLKNISPVSESDSAHFW